MTSPNAEYADALVVQRWPGLYINSGYRGCRTCGWFCLEADDPDDEKWLNHGHDPIYDITERVLSGARLVPGEDVIYLLEVIDKLKSPLAHNEQLGDTP